jgi:hypothetical protein
VLWISVRRCGCHRRHLGVFGLAVLAIFILAATGDVPSGLLVWALRILAGLWLACVAAGVAARVRRR